MDSIDDSSASAAATPPPPSLLTIILDTNPHAWALLHPSLPLSTAIANLLVFINAHLAVNYANTVAVIASHCNRAQWLYPTHKDNSSATISSTSSRNDDTAASRSRAGEGGGDRTNGSHVDADGDVDMTSNNNNPTNDSLHNTYRPFRIIEEQLTRNLKALLSSTSAADVSSTTSTQISGALTLALAYINRETIAYTDAHGGSASKLDHSTSHISSAGLPPPPGSSNLPSSSTSSSTSGLQSRILILSVSSATTSAHQYIPIMNSIFACQRLHIPIDILKLTGDAVFLQQAADATRGIYMSLSANPRGLLQYLMLAFLPDQRARTHLIMPTTIDVDFRAACFCHRNVVDVGYVCSICLSIFCQPPAGGVCLTCGEHLEVPSEYAGKPVVLAARKKKRKKGNTAGAGSRNGAASGTATPTPTPTPMQTPRMS
ncbi:hypothetical protein AJ80_01349 [Polytolypa hystricis UAMH7299]|uniref:General transcription and DNA repair factor IIH subunit TFB4 n=1 Tax=Polytolypa hystricis (strain UAMH7299) TaxID=1447883 RepID=A0A2B7Z044_POLH7|nr:hypothetical protein AJ80_01349 [Polytolypa hystricis UAMH7299]